MTKSARLEIHQIDVGAGDSVLIINRDLDAVKATLTKKGKLSSTALNGLDPIHYVPYAIRNKISLQGTVKKALLVDGGEDDYGGNVYNYLVEHGAINPTKVKQPNLSILVSHYHDDHVAGLRAIIRSRASDKAPVKRRVCPAVVYQAQTTDKMTWCCQQWRKWVNEDVAAGCTTLVEVYPGGLTGGSSKAPVTFNLGTGVDGIPITVTLIAAGEHVRLKDSPLDLVQAKIKAKKGKFDPNDRSLVAVLGYGSFRLFLGGDIAGDGGPDGGNTGTLAMGKKKAWSATHGDVETAVGQALRNLFPKTTAPTVGHPKFTQPGYCTVMKADHHGSSSSNDVFLFSVIRPLIVQNGSGLRPKPNGHPTQQVILRASAQGAGLTWLQPPPTSVLLPVGNTVAGLYITEVAQKWATKTKTDKPGQATRLVDLKEARIVGDIVVRPIDETVSAVQGVAKFGEKLTVQVYGTGDQFDVAEFNKHLEARLKNKYGLFPTTTVAAAPVPASPANGYYFKGPWEHSDIH